RAARRPSRSRRPSWASRPRRLRRSRGLTIEYADFETVDMRVGRVLRVDDFPEARVPAWKLTIDFGPEVGEKRSSAQITHYTREELEGSLVVAVVNFAPKRIAGFPSEVL